MASPDFLQHHKFRVLRQMLGVGTAHALGLCEMVWQYAYEQTSAVIGNATKVEAVAGWEGEPGKLINALLTCGGAGNAGLIEPVNGYPGLYQVHDLADHAPPAVAKRLRRAAKREAEGVTLSEVRAEAGRRGAAVTNAKASEAPESTRNGQIDRQTAASGIHLPPVVPMSSASSPRVSFSPPRPPSYPSLPSPPPPSPHPACEQEAREAPEKQADAAAPSAPPLLRRMQAWAAAEDAPAPDPAAVAAFVAVVAAEPPVVRSGVSISRLDVAILAADRARRGGREYRNLPYALATLRGMLADDAARAARADAQPRDGPPKPRKPTAAPSYVQAGEERLARLAA